MLRVPYILSMHSNIQGRVNRTPAWPLTAAFIIGACYGQSEPLASIALFAPLIILTLVAFWILARQSQHKVGPQAIQGLLAMGGICLSSILGACLNGDLQSVGQSIAVFWVALALVIIGGRVSIDRACASFALAAVVVTFMFLLLSYNDVLLRLSLSGAQVAEEVRYAGPFDSHPNLIGHMMGLFAVATFWQAVHSKWYAKLILLSSCMISLVMCLAASSRGGLLAAVGAISGTYVLSAFRGPKHLRRLFLFVLLASICFMPYLTAALDAAAELLEFNSVYRGIDSGMSGRTEIWAATIEQLGTEHAPLIWGAGMRNKWFADLNVDNSYLVILVEAGIPGLLLWLWMVVSQTGASARGVLRRATTSDLTIFAILLFSLVEAVVNRQFLAIGNPASLFLLLMVLTYVAPMRTAGGAAIAVNSRRLLGRR